MDDPPPTAAQLPVHVRWFAPWTWRPWMQRLMLYALLVGFILSPTPIEYLRIRFQTDRYPLIDWPLELATRPFHAAMSSSQLVAVFYEIQWRWLNATFGPAFPPVD